MNHVVHPAKRLLPTALGLLLAAGAMADRVRYRVTDLGSLGALTSQATAINDKGVVAGNLRFANGRVKAFVWDARGGMRLVDPLAVQSAAFGINRRGQVVGSVQTEDGLVDAVRWEANGSRTLLAWAPYGAAATAVNERGEAVGYRNEGLNFIVQEAFAWPAKDRFSAWTDLFDSSTESFATDINNRGDVVGNSNGQAFLIRRDGQVFFLTPPSSAPAFAEAVNDRRDVLISWAGTGYLMTGRKVLDILAPNADIQFVFPLDVNGRRDVVGETDEEAFVWDPTSGSKNLGDLTTASGSTWRLLGATSVNQRGEIVGYGLHNGLRRAFLLTPVINSRNPDAP